MIEAAREGSPMSVARLVEMFADAGALDSEGILRGAIRVAYFNAETAAGLLRIIDGIAPGLADQAIRDLKVRSH